MAVKNVWIIFSIAISQVSEIVTTQFTACQHSGCYFNSVHPLVSPVTLAEL